MAELLNKRELLFAGVGLGAMGMAGAALAQTAPAAATAPGVINPPRRRVPVPVPVQQAKTNLMWQVPKGALGLVGAPNAIALDERGRGLWYGEENGPLGDRENCPAVLVDFNGKEIKRLHTPSFNVSGMAQGGGYIWIGHKLGFYQVDIDTNEITHRDHPLTPPGNPSGNTHGMAWDDDNKKLWLADPQTGVIFRIDPKTFAPDRAIKIDTAYFGRTHGIGYRDGFLYQAAWRDNTPGVESTRYDMGLGGIIKYNINTGLPVLYIAFGPNSIDPHAVAVDKAGKIYICDAGLHPGIPERTPPYSGYVGTVTLL